MENFLDFNFSQNILYCKEFVDNLLQLLYYSHIPTAIVALFIGIYVFLRNKDTLSGKILFSISVCFFLWSFLDLAIWTNYANNSVLMFAWSLIEIFSVSLFLLCLYFIYTFVYQKDAPFLYKLIFSLLLLPVVFAASTTFNLTSYDIQECVAIENSYFLNYVFYLKLSLSVLIVGLALVNFFRSKFRRKLEIALLSLGVVSFVFAFFIAGQISERTGIYIFEIYGLFGMVVFMGFLAYLIVKFQTFNIKMLGVQALVASLIMLVAAQFTFIDNKISIILNSVTVLLTFGFGYMLIKGVKREIQQREHIEKLAQDLEKANFRLRELDQMKSQFLSFASHQIRSPLTAIKGYTSMALEGDFGEMPEKIKGVVETLDKSAQSLIVIVNEFLDVSRIEQGRMKYEMVDFDVKKLVEETVAELRPNVEIKGLKFAFSAEDNQNYSVHADQGKIKQVIGNIVDNAIKYTPSGSINVNVSRTKSTVNITVTDTGVGIEPELIPKLFSMFGRAKDASKTNVSGTGLGLYVAKEMVEAHRGQIWIESEGKGKGSTFHIELPAKN